MMAEIPKQKTESSIDDIQSADINIDSMVEKFIRPIDAKRSYFAPNILASSRTPTSDGQKASPQDVSIGGVSKRELQESRCHTFYRMLGLPVVAIDASYYNPGFNAIGGRGAKQRHEAVASKVSQVVREMQNTREREARRNLSVFKMASINASVYGVALGLPRSSEQKRFSLIDTNKKWYQEDDQKFTNKKRQEFIQREYETSSGEDITEFFNERKHILRPMTVDAAIERTVQPGDRVICQPFLKDRKATRFDEPNIHLERPGIEFVLRLRLNQHSDIDNLTQAIQALSSERASSVELAKVSVADLRVLATALLNERNIVDLDTAKKTLSGASNLEIITIDSLVKMLKGLVDLLARSMEQMAEVIENMNWTPLPSENGPEGGTEIARFIRTKVNRSKVEQRIYRLEAKQKNAKRQVALTSQTNSDLKYSDFALSEFQNTEKLFVGELNRAKERRDELEKNGSRALQIIEHIVGEVSGFGLVDVLAIYTALWAIDINVLVGMLDDDAFQRLYDNNRDLRTDAVERRHSDGQIRNSKGQPSDITTLIEEFEKQVVDILSFTDRLFELRLGNKTQSQGGDLPRSG
jgi:hypothetical protein